MIFRFVKLLGEKKLVQLLCLVFEISRRLLRQLAFTIQLPVRGIVTWYRRAKDVEKTGVSAVSEMIWRSVSTSNIEEIRKA